MVIKLSSCFCCTNGLALDLFLFHGFNGAGITASPGDSVVITVPGTFLTNLP